MEDFQDLKKMASIYEYRCAKKIKVSGCVSTKIESNDTIPTKIKINSDFRQKKPQHGRKFAAWPCPLYG